MNADEKRQLEYAHKYYRDESRGFWAKVAALLTINSLLLIGFTTLNISCNANPTLLLVIAASGITIQALWPLFAIQSYSMWESLGNKIKGKEVKDDNKKLLVAEALKSGYETLARPLEFCIPQGLYRVFSKNPAGVIAIFLFFAIFMAIWLVAEVTVDTSTCLICHLLAISLPTIVVAFSVLISVISAILVYRKHEEVTQNANKVNESRTCTKCICHAIWMALTAIGAVIGYALAELEVGALVGFGVGILIAVVIVCWKTKVWNTRQEGKGSK